MDSIFGSDGIIRISEQDELVALSNSLIVLLGSHQEALIVQKLHSWILEGKGIVIDGDRWFDKSIEDWIIKLLNLTERKMRSYMSSLEKKGVIERKQLTSKHHGHSHSPKNRTYYYRLDYEGLSKLITEVTNSKNGGAE
jgi:hypothetical protein